MDTRYPHKIVESIEQVPEAERKHFRPLSESKARMLIDMTPEQRGAWLREHPIDRDLVQRIQREEKRHAKRKRRLGAKLKSIIGTKRDPERERTGTDVLRRAIQIVDEERTRDAGAETDGHERAL